MDVDLIGWVGVGFGGTYGCRYDILYVPMLGVVLSEPEDGRYRPKHVVFPLLINTII